MDKATSTTSAGGGPATSSSNYIPPTASGFPVPPPILALLLLVGGLILHSFSRAPRMVFAHQLLGLLIIAGSVGLAAHAAALFRARSTTLNPRGEATAFVVVTPYTFTRNPMYLGTTLVLFGFAVFFASVVMLLAPTAYFLIIDRLVIPLEEQNLERLFGPQYSDYKTRVRRWL